MTSRVMDHWTGAGETADMQQDPALVALSISRLLVGGGSLLAPA
jgi:hypothetical protein